MRRDWNQGEDEARERGNPYPWNSPAFDYWNAGYDAAVAKMARRITKLRDRGPMAPL